MGARELWVESYQGEVLGEALFATLAEREPDPGRRHLLEVLTVLERATKVLAEPVFTRGGFDRGDDGSSLATAKAFADVVAGMSWEDFLRSFEPVVSEFLARYEELVTLADDPEDRAVAAAYVAHEQALSSFARRCLGEEEGEPLERILALPHVAAALG